MAETINFDKKKYGYVFNIQRYSVHDGPGIRTIVFLKGCPLQCQWCANPESQHVHPEVAFNKNKCIGVKDCGLCINVCQTGAIKTSPNNGIIINRELCNNCSSCADVCPSKALNMYGKVMAVNEVLNLVEQDSMFYARSGGGMTLSGGEPLLQADFAVELLKEAKRRRINTNIETCGFSVWENLDRACQYLDNIFYDIKCIDTDKHQQYTGVHNEKILQNLKKLCTEYPTKNVTVRTPVIPGFNDTEEDILAIIDLIKGFPNVKYELLAYHRLGEPKYGYIGKEYPLNGIPPMKEEQIAGLKKLVKEKLCR